MHNGPISNKKKNNMSVSYLCSNNNTGVARSQYKLKSRKTLCCFFTLSFVFGLNKQDTSY